MCGARISKLSKSLPRLLFLAMLLLGLVATWIPAQRALSIDPLTLLRED
jgi:ABC-type lipoprotein release transport system permease subunit